MATLDLGQVRPVYKGAWDSETTYIPHDWVTYDYDTWLTEIDTPAGNIPSLDSEYWIRLTIQGEKGDTGAQGAQGEQGIQGPAVSITSDIFDDDSIAISTAGIYSWKQEVETDLATLETTANSAVTNAATAQTTANSAVTNAATAQTTANSAVTTAASKADTDLSNTNPSQDFIDTSTGWMVPDYDNAVTIANSVSTTMLADGCLYVGGMGYNGEKYIYVNGTSIAYIHRNFSGYNWTDNLFMPVAKGDVVLGTVSGSNMSLSLKFYPFKGAITDDETN